MINWCGLLERAANSALVPIDQYTLKLIRLYLIEERNQQQAQKGEEDVLFLNRFGKRISRVFVFTLVKKLCQMAGIQKNVSPHTFRHSFATHSGGEWRRLAICSRNVGA